MANYSFWIWLSEAEEEVARQRGINVRDVAVTAVGQALHGDPPPAHDADHRSIEKRLTDLERQPIIVAETTARLDGLSRSANAAVAKIDKIDDAMARWHHNVQLKLDRGDKSIGSVERFQDGLSERLDRIEAGLAWSEHFVKPATARDLDDPPF